VSPSLRSGITSSTSTAPRASIAAVLAILLWPLLLLDLIAIKRT